MKKERINKDQAMELIKRCLSSEEDNPECDAATESYRNIHTDGFFVDTVSTYDLNLDSVEITYMHGFIHNEDNWDGNYGAHVVFRYDEGYGLATHTGWWGPTFSGDTWVLDVCETDDFMLFDKLCLTTEIRAALEEVFDKEAREVLLDDRSPQIED